MPKFKPIRPEPSNEPLPESIRFDELDEISKDVFTHFGIEAAGKLNQYSIALEDALIEQVKRNQQHVNEVKRLRALLEEHDIKYN